MKQFRWPVLAVAVVAICSTGFAYQEDGGDGGGGSALTVQPSSLTFTASAGAANTGAQSLQVTIGRGTGFTVAVSSGQAWLSVAPAGTLSGSRTLAVSVNATHLAAGTFHGQISLTQAGRSSINVPVTLTVSVASTGSGLTVSPGSVTFNGTAGGSAPAAQTVTVSASTATKFTVSVTTQSGGAWLVSTPTGSLTTTQKLAISVKTTGLAAATYSGTLHLTTTKGATSVPVSLVLAASGGGGGTGGGTASGYKIMGWNDLGMHCMDGRDYSVFAVLPPYNTIHAHLVDGNGNLVATDIGYTVTYQAIVDPLTNTINTSTVPKTNFWQYAAALGFGSLKPDVGLAGFAMPGASNTPQSMTFTPADNTWTATGIPLVNYADSTTGNYPVNYYPMMRLTAKNSLGTVLATTDIVLPISDELTCGTCHASNTGVIPAKPAAGWVNNPDPAKDMKLNILRKHDDRFALTALYQSAAKQLGFSATGLEATVATKPVLCDACHGSNALALAGFAGINPLTQSIHGLHATQIDPATGQTMDAGTTRNTCYGCHPGPKTQCLRGVMGTLQAATGGNAIECQSCHGNLSNVANGARQGWLDEPSCQSCHTGTAVSNSGQIVYTSAFASGTTYRVAADQTYATNANTPGTGESLYRFSKGHGGLQCESCHGSTHAEFATPIVNDNVQSIALQGHSGMLSECTACHATVPSTVTGGPHGLHPIGTSWVSSHQDVADSSGATQCQVCHGTDYRGTVLSRVQADRTLAGRTFTKGTMIGCYSCHNGPNGG